MSLSSVAIRFTEARFLQVLPELNPVPLSGNYLAILINRPTFQGRTAKSVGTRTSPSRSQRGTGTA